MRRVIAILLGTAVVVAAAQLPALHTHLYTDHDHPEHRHGPAAHDHHVADVHADDNAVALRLESCDPGHHAVSSFVLRSAALTHQHSIDGECDAPGAFDPPPALPAIAFEADVRVHGPPPRSQAAPRAPPFADHA